MLGDRRTLFDAVQSGEFEILTFQSLKLNFNRLIWAAQSFNSIRWRFIFFFKCDDIKCLILGNLKEVKKLINAAADVNLTNKYGSIPLHLAAGNGKNNLNQFEHLLDS